MPSSVPELNSSASSASSALLNGAPRSGDLAVIRGRMWRVAWVTPHADCASIRVMSDDPQVPTATFLHPFDDVHPIRQRSRIARVSRRTAVALLGRAIHEITPFPALVASADAAIDLLPYQLEPALALIAGTATRVLIADDVGLGKTIQAGIAIKELATRNEASHTLLIVPAGLVAQWKEELRSKFGVDAERVDATWLRLMGRSLPPWVNPWTLPGVLLLSIDLLKRREVVAQLENIAWDLVVIDEAHRATGATDRHRAASHVCARSRRVVLLTATPHAGDPAAFRQIQELGTVPGDQLRTLTFARTRSAVAASALRRRARYLRVSPTHEERLMHRALDRYVARMLRASPRDSVQLAMMVLKKRALSSAFSLKRSLLRRLTSIEEPADQPFQVGLQFDDDPSGELVPDDREPDSALAVTTLGEVPREREQLGRLIALASAAERRQSKVGLLRRVLARTREPVIVFTEYRDTLDHLAASLSSAATPVLLHGGLAPDERHAAVSSFTRGRARVLLATDAAAEGLNLHERCRWVINLELPWAPLRLIQRAGRVDRIGQRRRVHAWHLVARDTEETRLLLSLSRRAEAAASALARERALGEHAVAAALFDGIEPVSDPADVQLKTACGSSDAARLEALRLTQIREFRPRRRHHDASAACGIARVKRRGGFSRYASRDLLLVFSGRAIDAQGCPIATRVGAARLSATPGVNDLERQLRTDVTRYDRAAKVAAARRSAVCSIVEGGRALLQPALFDRRALERRETSDRQIADARRQLGRPVGTNASLLFDLVVGFEVK